MGDAGDCSDDIRDIGSLTEDAIPPALLAALTRYVLIDDWHEGNRRADTLSDGIPLDADPDEEDAEAGDEPGPDGPADGEREARHHEALIATLRAVPELATVLDQPDVAAFLADPTRSSLVLFSVLGEWADLLIDIEKMAGHLVLEHDRAVNAGVRHDDLVRAHAALHRS